MAFLHHSPPTFAILVMELVTGIEVPRYGSKFFRFYIPQVHDSQTDFCLFARKRLNKHKFRFSLDDSSMTTWTDSCYGGKILMTPTADTKRFKLLAAKPAGRVQFDIKQEARKQELVVRLNSQKFINPMADVRCSKTNYTLFKIEKEGETGMQKYVISYMRPFSLFVRYEQALANMESGRRNGDRRLMALGDLSWVNVLYVNVVMNVLAVASL
ncbi:hypothetical protein BBJ28_00005878 [Nothophytophthora sp. Chile5]|nr:hypothetical protein BBJ28_00005878 [Nothophytophthora sp. Chile5]